MMGDHTVPNAGTAEATQVDARSPHAAGPPPTVEEEAAAEEHQSEEDGVSVAEHYEEMVRLGAEVRGEGEIE